MGVDWWSPGVVKGVSEIWAALSSTRNVPTDLTHYSGLPLMPKRRVPSDEEDEANGNAHQSASEEEVVRKPKKSTVKSEKTKASARFDARYSYQPTAVLTFVLRHNPARSRRKKKKLLQATEVSRPTKKGIDMLIWDVVDEQRFASSKARHYT